MARSHYWQYLINEEGQPVEAAVINVYEVTDEGDVDIEIYTAESGGSIIVPGTLETDSNGFFDFCVPNELDPVDTVTYSADTLFKIAWEKANVISGSVDDVKIIYDNSKIHTVEISTSAVIALVLSQMQEILVVNTAGVTTVALPHVGINDIGKWIQIQKMGAGNLTINVADVGDTIEGETQVANTEAGETDANITLYLATATTWKYLGAPFGTWVASS